MSWLSKVVRPKLRELVSGPRDIPDNLWQKCAACEQLVFLRDLDVNLHVCPHCGQHHRINVEQRFRSLFDDQNYQLIELPKPTIDPLRFKDRRKYTDRLKEAQSKTGYQEALAVAKGIIGSLDVIIACLNFQFLGGSMGTAVGDGLLIAAQQAIIYKVPLIIVCASGGARMQEGILSLMQMARTTIAVTEVRENGMPVIVVLADPTTGGVSASFAMLGDISIAEPGAVVGFAGARVIEQTIRESLPDGFQRAEYLLEHGMIDMVVHRRDLRITMIKILSLICIPT